MFKKVCSKRWLREGLTPTSNEMQHATVAERQYRVVAFERFPEYITHRGLNTNKVIVDYPPFETLPLVSSHVHPFFVILHVGGYLSRHPNAHLPRDREWKMTLSIIQSVYGRWTDTLEDKQASNSATAALWEGFISAEKAEAYMDDTPMNA
ncbi:hypothetical protein RhiJN_11233 [Ceratobasidium sp. AG-Ba]|nr:hypothetical protein RhiJN_11233 [Ceratobasidium sp. AG-Ba]